MKYTGILLLALLLQGCTYFYNHIEFDGSTPEIKSGTVYINNAAGKMIFSCNIQSGKFHIRQQQLAIPGYYMLSFIDNSQPYKRGMADEFEIYLEPGEYTVTTGRKGASKYPFITSSSKIQNELSLYYPMADSIGSAVRDTLKNLVTEMNTQKLSEAAYAAIVEKVKVAQFNEADIKTKILEKFIAKYPNNEVVAHLLANTDYERKPELNYNLYQKFSKAAKNSDDGQEIGDKLSHLVKMLPGAVAPLLVGETINCKTMDIKAMHKKIILVEFWRAGIQICRKNHQRMVSSLLPDLAGKGFGIISVSLDEKRDWWTTTIKEDKLTWPQISDSKGLNSPNVDSWGISDLPTYCLLDGNGRIIERDVPFDGIMGSVNSYLQQHP